MTFAFQKGRYGVKLAQSQAEVEQCQSLRHRCFFGGPGLDVDDMDEVCEHIMVASDRGLVATCRVRSFDPELNMSYSAQRYDISSLSIYGASMEVGRFCVLPTDLDADVLRLFWGAITRLVDQQGVKFLFGCASFDGVDPTRYGAAFGLLAERFSTGIVRKKSAEVIDISQFDSDQKQGMAQMPTLLRTYLTMGGWVSDHAVIDRELQTMHVFCGVEIDNVPDARAKALRAIAR